MPPIIVEIYYYLTMEIIDFVVVVVVIVVVVVVVLTIMLHSHRVSVECTSRNVPKKTMYIVSSGNAYKKWSIRSGIVLSCSSFVEE